MMQFMVDFKNIENQKTYELQIVPNTETCMYIKTSSPDSQTLSECCSRNFRLGKSTFSLTFFLTPKNNKQVNRSVLCSGLASSYSEEQHFGLQDASQRSSTLA